eukprot:2656814-Prymnesium_polylepis.1
MRVNAARTSGRAPSLLLVGRGVVIRVAHEALAVGLRRGHRRAALAARRVLAARRGLGHVGAAEGDARDLAGARGLRGARRGG